MRSVANQHRIYEVLFLALSFCAACDPGASILGCSPQALEPGGELVVDLSDTHGGDFGVWDPDGVFLHLAYDKVLPSEPESPIDPADFSNLSRLLLSVDSAEGLPVGDGIGPPRRIFTAGGTYTFLVADNLETDNSPSRVGRCEVEFSGR